MTPKYGISGFGVTRSPSGTPAPDSQGCYLLTFRLNWVHLFGYCRMGAIRFGVRAENRSGVDLRGTMTPLLASMGHLELF